MKNQQTIQGVISLIAIICLAVGWFNLFSPAINDILSKRVFYILIGASFLIQAPFLSSKIFIYLMYAAGALCIIGSFLPLDSRLAEMKTLGLLGGIIISFSNRQKQN